MRLTAHKNLTNSNLSRSGILAICTFFFCLGTYIGWKNIPGYLKANAVLLSEIKISQVLSEPNDLDTLRLDIAFKGIQKIEAKRKDALQRGLLNSSDKDFVKAEISMNEITHPCKIRLKGDLSDHWSGEKFSLRVEMKDGFLIKGMSRFSLQDPLRETTLQSGCILRLLPKKVAWRSGMIS